MTSEQRVFIEPRDIVAIEWECPKCHSRILVPFTDRNLLPERCGNASCMAKFFEFNSEDKKRIQHSFDELARYSVSENPIAILRLQVKP